MNTESKKVCNLTVNPAYLTELRKEYTESETRVDEANRKVKDVLARNYAREIEL